MYLKRLEIQGFKSFPERINIDFSKGITAIVGPNGSGKSNISDAIRWVLGEQSIKSLRGSKMQDVIFSGTQRRKQMGFAEVSLTIDNSTGLLPLDYSEITVTRRIFRSGESEYQINKVACRLKDIHELFFDTGVGKDGYSVIGQGRIDEILTAKPEERRAIFEEASGIMKYKVKKEEAERKLELTRINIVRLDDIICELEIQLEPLKEQSEAAQKFIAIKEELKNIEIGLFVENLDKLKQKEKELDELIDTAEIALQNERNKRGEIRLQIENTESMIGEQRQALEMIRNSISNLDIEIEKNNSQIKINSEKINNIISNNSRIDSEITEYEKKISLINSDNEQNIGCLSSINEEIVKLETSLKQCEEHVAGIDCIIGDSEKYVEKLNNTIFEKMNNMTDLRDKAAALESVVDNLKQRQDELNKEIESLMNQDTEIQIKINNDKQQITDIINSIEKASAKVLSVKDKKKELELKLEKLNIDLHKKKVELQSNQSRYELLTDMERNFEGYSRSVKQALTACNNDKQLGAGVHGTLAGLISTDRKYEIAVEVALGGALQNIVTETEQDAKRIIEFLKSNNLGRVTFLPISSVKCREKVSFGDICKHAGFICSASEVIHCDEKYDQIVESLLGKVIISNDLDSGINIASRTGYKYKIVTLDGELLNTTGALTGGSLKGNEQGIFGRRRQIADIQAAIEKNISSIKAFESDVALLNQSIADYDNQIDSDSEFIRKQDILKIKFESELKQLTDNIVQIRTKHDLCRIEFEQLSKKQNEDRDERSELLQKINQYEYEIAQIKENINKETEKTKTERLNKETLGSDITNYKLSINTLKQNIKSTTDKIANNEAQANDLKATIDAKTQEKQQNTININQLNSDIENFRNMTVNNTKHKEQFIYEQHAICNTILDDENIIKNADSQLKSIDETLLHLQEERGRLDVKKARIDVEIENVQNKMWDEYQITYSVAIEHRKHIENINKAYKRANELRGQLNSLGNVNINAIDDYKKTKERYEFLSVQRDDLTDTETKLKKVISEVIYVMKRQFENRFREINGSFNKVFQELFEGGRAELKMVDSDNILESGIEIEVQPPGKKLQNMMLLSGGERALTAIALLFGILRLKPAPFCVLDEIESSLDESNAYRFSKYLFDYASKNQFILITHRKATMEIADTLYGVTMQENGISTLLSLDFSKSVEYAN